MSILFADKISAGRIQKPDGGQFEEWILLRQHTITSTTGAHHTFYLTEFLKEFDALKLVINDLTNTTDGKAFYIQVGGSELDTVVGGNYNYCEIGNWAGAADNSLSTAATRGQTWGSMGSGIGPLGNDAKAVGCGEYIFPNWKSTVGYKRMYGFSQIYTNSNYVSSRQVVGCWRNTSPIEIIRFGDLDTNTMDGGDISIYGSRLTNGNR